MIREFSRGAISSTDRFLVGDISRFFSWNSIIRSASIYGERPISVISRILNPIITDILAKSGRDPLVTGEYLLNETLKYMRSVPFGDVFVFPHSPKEITYSFSVLDNISELGGNVVSRLAWGAKVIPLSVSGWANLHPPKPIVDMIGYPDYRLSWGFVFLQALKEFFDRLLGRTLLIIASSRVWVGWYKSMNYSMKAQSIFSADWSISFSAHPSSGALLSDIQSVIDLAKNLSSSGNVLSIDYGNPDSWVPTSRDNIPPSI